MAVTSIEYKVSAEKTWMTTFHCIGLNAFQGYFPLLRRGFTYRGMGPGPSFRSDLQTTYGTPPPQTFVFIPAHRLDIATILAAVRIKSCVKDKCGLAWLNEHAVGF